MTILARQCKCGAAMRHARIGSIDLFVCPQCDRRRCEHCQRTTGRLLAPVDLTKKIRCEHSDCQKVLG